MLFVAIKKGKMTFKYGDASLGAFGPDEREKAVQALSTVPVDVLNDGAVCSSSVDFSEEEGWPKKVNAHMFLGGVLRDAIRAQWPSTKERAGTVLQVAKDLLEDPAAKAWVERDPKGVWHQRAEELVVKYTAEWATVNYDRVDSNCGIKLALEVLTTMLNNQRKKRTSRAE